MSSISDHSFRLDSPGQSIMDRAGVPNVLFTQCTSVFPSLASTACFLSVSHYFSLLLLSLSSVFLFTLLAFSRPSPKSTCKQNTIQIQHENICQQLQSLDTFFSSRKRPSSFLVCIGCKSGSKSEISMTGLRGKPRDAV